MKDVVSKKGLICSREAGNDAACEQIQPFSLTDGVSEAALLGSEHHRGVICDIFMVAVDGQAESSPLRDPRLLTQTPLGGGAMSRISNDLALHIFLRICYSETAKSM